MSKNKVLAGCATSMTLLAAMMAAQTASAHGFLSEPPSRAFLCQKGVNTGCGGAQYEPQSVGETFKGFPAGVGGAPMQGPIDGQIASGSTSRFTALDAQSANRWHLNEIKYRAIDFVWTYTASHPATKHEYFISKNGWNPNQPLARATFDSTPFCTIDGGNQKPSNGTKHACTIPDDKTGQHVILALWTVGDTAAAFHSVTDVNILAEAALPGGWTNAGTITADTELLQGDKVKVRAFTVNGESPQYSTEISIDSEQEGKAENWSFKLAEAINSTHTLVRAGLRDDDGNIEPVKGANNLYAQKDSGVVRFEVSLEMKEDAAARMDLAELNAQYELDAGLGQVTFQVDANRPMNVEATVFDANNKQVGQTKQLAADGSTRMSVDVRTAPGVHGVKLVGTTEDGRTMRQDFKETELTGEGGAVDFDFVFPEHLHAYTAGTKVLNPKTNSVYECKPFPYSGYCKQYSPSANGFEPGVGHSWQMAWDQK
ncbi:N-acetylglucosamine-binding protein GbpA [Pseudomonas sp. GD03860]|nr:MULTISPECIES: N-acetylglucosamine-binding protein GbpA [Pseudomonas]MDD2058616.1 N-acetylglucosamine-binding protein GbpA [Pseudomonas putida]MDH0640805.1 N-acetylglucosamine-binding protein GbpA [Pseudomonas sp. GD03860]